MLTRLSNTRAGQPILLISNTRTINNFIPVIKKRTAQAVANVQPFKPKELLLSPIDQRSWSYYNFTVQSPVIINSVASDNPSIDVMNTADQILWQTSYYKILSTYDWQTTHGFVKYECIKDFQNTPNNEGPNIARENGIALCDIISQFFTSTGNPLDNDQIFLYNSNFTPPVSKGFFIVIQLTGRSAFGFGGVKHIQNPDGTTIETVQQNIKEDYSIHIVSADGSATNIQDKVALALQGGRDYALEKSAQVGFNMSEVSEAENLSDITGGSIVNRWRIKLSLLTSSSEQIIGSPSVAVVDFTTWFQQN